MSDPGQYWGKPRASLKSWKFEKDHANLIKWWNMRTNQKKEKLIAHNHTAKKTQENKKRYATATVSSTNGVRSGRVQFSGSKLRWQVIHFCKLRPRYKKVWGNELVDKFGFGKFWHFVGFISLRFPPQMMSEVDVSHFLDQNCADRLQKTVAALQSWKNELGYPLLGEFGFGNFLQVIFIFIHINLSRNIFLNTSEGIDRLHTDDDRSLYFFWILAN